jgi:hypothetical protein
MRYLESDIENARERLELDDIYNWDLETIDNVLSSIRLAREAIECESFDFVSIGGRIIA